MFYVAQLMRAEITDRNELVSTIMDAGIEGMIFANDPEMWQRLYGSKKDPEQEAHEEVEWASIGSEDFKSMLREAVEAGALELDD